MDVTDDFSSILFLDKLNESDVHVRARTGDNPPRVNPAELAFQLLLYKMLPTFYMSIFNLFSGQLFSNQTRLKYHALVSIWKEMKIHDGILMNLIIRQIFSLAAGWSKRVL